MKNLAIITLFLFCIYANQDIRKQEEVNRHLQEQLEAQQDSLQSFRQLHGEHLKQCSFISNDMIKKTKGKQIWLK